MDFYREAKASLYENLAERAEKGKKRETNACDPLLICCKTQHLAFGSHRISVLPGPRHSVDRVTTLTRLTFDPIFVCSFTNLSHV